MRLKLQQLGVIEKGLMCLQAQQDRLCLYVCVCVCVLAK